jgi:hypothetical protein
MTEKEFQKVRRELAERKARTSFPPGDPRDLYNAHGGHTESGGSKH